MVALEETRKNPAPSQILQGCNSKIALEKLTSVS